MRRAARDCSRRWHYASSTSSSMAFASIRCRGARPVACRAAGAAVGHGQGRPSALTGLDCCRRTALAQAIKFYEMEFSPRSSLLVAENWTASRRPTGSPSRAGRRIGSVRGQVHCSFVLVSIGASIDRLRLEIWKSVHLIFTVTVRPRPIRFLAPGPEPSSAIAITPASIRAGSVRSSEKVVSDPEDFRSRSD